MAITINTNIMVVKEATEDKVASAEDIYSSLKEFSKAAQEMFFVITLNQKHAIIDKHLVSMGTVSETIVHPRECFRPAIMDGAAAVIFAHNHPSGETFPSMEDKQITERLKEAGKILGIRVLDHVIIGDNYFSFVDRGFM